MTKRVVGDTVTLAIVEGEAKFALGDQIARLRDSSKTEYTSDAESPARRLAVT